MTNIVLIDGENFLHRVFDVLKANSIVSSKNDITAYDFKGLFAEVFGAQMGLADYHYFGTRIRHQSNQPELQQKTKQLIESQRHLKRFLTNRQIQFIYAGNLRLRDGKSCSNCGFQTPYFVEKGVDVAIATKLLELATERFAGNVLLVCSDSDLLPAIRVARHKGLSLTYVAVETSINLALAKTIGKTQTIAETKLATYYKMTQ